MSMFVNEQDLNRYENKQMVQAINEAYFGRTPGIMRCFNTFCDFRQKYKSRKFDRGVSIKNIDADHDKNLHLFCKEMERQFGFYSFSFIIQNSLQSNMCTIPIMFHEKGYSDVKKYLVMDKEGYHFKEDVKMSCIVIAYAQMIFDANITDEEAFAIVLHEIGHNFQKVLSDSMLKYGLINSVIYVYAWTMNILNGLYLGRLDAVGQTVADVMVSSSHSSRKMSKFYNSVTSKENKNNLYSYFNYVNGILSVPLSVIQAILMVPLAPVLGLVSGLSNLLNNMNIPTIAVARYTGELIADNFPSYYGFGKATIDFQSQKSPNPYGPAVEFVSEVPLIGHLYNLVLIPAEMMSSIADEHPDRPVRCASVISSMKSDLKDTRLSPKLREQLKKEISESEKAIDEYYKEAKKVKNPKFLKNCMDKIVFDKGGDSKYKFMRAIFVDTEEEIHDIDKMMRENVIDIEGGNDMWKFPLNEADDEDEKKKNSKEEKEPEDDKKKKDDDSDDDYNDLDLMGDDTEDSDDDKGSDDSDDDYNDLDLMGDDSDDDDTSLDDDLDGSDDSGGDYNTLIVVKGGEGSGDDMFNLAAKVAYAYTVITNNMKHIHLNACGEKFQEIHNICDDLYYHFKNVSDRYYELAAESPDITIDNPTRAKEHCEDVPVENDKDYDFRKAFEAVDRNLEAAIKYINNLRDASSSRPDIQSGCDEQLSYLNKQSKYFIRKKLHRAGDSLEESCMYNSLF